jgi:uncharacterized protein
MVNKVSIRLMTYISSVILCLSASAEPQHFKAHHPYQPAVPPIIIAVKAKDLRKARSLVAQGADVNARQHTGDSSFHRIGNSKPQTADAMHRLAQNVDGMTPLILAAGWGDKEMLSFLIKKGAKINTQDIDGRTALIWASIAEREDNVRLLLRNKANTHIVDKKGNDAVGYAGNEKIERLLKSASNSGTENKNRLR